MACGCSPTDAARSSRRSRKRDDVVSSLLGHSSLRASTRGCERECGAAFVNSDGRAVIVLFPVGYTEPLVERRLEAIGWSVIDRLAVDVERRNADRRPVAFTLLGVVARSRFRRRVGVAIVVSGGVACCELRRSAHR